jgi:ABC-2 type transport system permease protein
MPAPSTPSPRTAPLVKLAEARKTTLGGHIVNIFRLVIKELRSIRADPTMLILVAYAFSISVNTVATGAVTEATNLSVGIVDEDDSELSREIAAALVRPTFQPAVQIKASEIDPKMDAGELLLVVEIPPNFQADILAQRKTSVQINVDATAVARPATAQATSARRSSMRCKISSRSAAVCRSTRSISSCAPALIPT